MPIKLKKTNIQYDIETPDSGYVILGFDESGTLVTKNEFGNYEPIVNDISTGSFVRLEVDYLTVGNRPSGIDEGLYSITQGLNVSASGDTSYAQGSNAVANAPYTYARGEFVEANGYLSYVAGAGSSSLNKLYSSGINSFVHQFSISISSGSLADYSAILGGRNHNIGSLANDSVILGGTANTVNSSITNSVVIGGTNQIADLSNTIFAPRIVLKNTASVSKAGLLFFDGSNFYGHNGSSAKKLDTSVNTPGANRIVTTDSSSNLYGQSNLLFDGATLSTTGTISGGKVSTDILEQSYISTVDLQIGIQNGEPYTPSYKRRYIRYHIIAYSTTPYNQDLNYGWDRYIDLDNFEVDGEMYEVDIEIFAELNPSGGKGGDIYIRNSSNNIITQQFLSYNPGGTSHYFKLLWNGGQFTNGGYTIPGGWWLLKSLDNTAFKEL